jgi:RND family efflux transporter MFP subunit
MKVLPLIALAAAILATASIVRTKPVRQRTDPPVAPPTAQFSDTVAAVGLVEASTENVSIGTHLSGVVEQVFVSVGQAVKAGDRLFRLDTRSLEAGRLVRIAALETATAQMSTAETTLADAQDQFARSEKLRKERVISEDELVRRRFAVQTAESRVGEARAAITTAKAQIGETEIDLARSIVTAPMDGEVLQVKVRAGEFAPAGQTSVPLLVLGCLQPLHVRVDVDEHEGWRVRPEAGAVAHIRGKAELKSKLRFVRFEPMVVPKRSLSGDSTERVDTRVLQVIYEVLDQSVPLFVGQQMDVFIEAGPGKLTAKVR